MKKKDVEKSRDGEHRWHRSSQGSMCWMWVKIIHGSRKLFGLFRSRKRTLLVLDDSHIGWPICHKHVTSGMGNGKGHLAGH